MQRYWLPTIIVTLITAFVTTTTVQAKDPLASLVKRKTLSKRDQARMEAEVTERVGRLRSAGTSADRREGARERLIATAKVKGATSEGLSEYAKVCGESLRGLVSKDEFTVAFDSVMVLVELQNAETGPALTQGLRSPHAAVRYMCARGLRLLHKDLATGRACSAILGELGRCGEKEAEEIVLKEIYRAIDFAADVPRFTKANDAAEALNRIFAVRLDSVLDGSNDEWLDEFGYDAAAGCYAGASPRQKRALLKHMKGFVEQDVKRFFDADTVDGAKMTLANLVVSAEEAIRTMLKASKADAPSCSLKDSIRTRRPKQEDAMACLESFKQAIDAVSFD